ncbi:helix-turn-helix domain-containing protein [Priestia endophytica]|jgi:predicted transcriptional regulator YheO|uniref:helix-turn-helix domain-containing protein n=1 Tax=Priestia endophytica TaxID=135735 RepID=UPI0018CCEB08|nr:helix-turn-helix domain-containing protein [Priestia endophytica]
MKWIILLIETSTLEKNTEEEDNGNEMIEYFTDSLDEVVYSIIDPTLLNPNVALKQEQKVEIISQLYKKGIFQLKGAVSQVAELLNIFEPSVYRYLKMIDNNKK